jgi:hypothetical protein
MGVFYRKDRLELLYSGNFWLSETPEQPGRCISRFQGYTAQRSNRLDPFSRQPKTGLIRHTHG